MTSVKILHISDLHISKNPYLTPMNRRSLKDIYKAILRGTYAASYSQGILKALVEFVHSRKGSLDAILITGDISTTGLDYDLQQARRFVEGVPDAHDIRTTGGFPTISGAGLPIFLLPGNHDRYKLLLRRLGYAPGNRRFHQVFHNHWRADVKSDFIIKGDLAVGIFAADFSLRKWYHADALPNIFVNAHAQGKVYPDILTELENATSTFQDENNEEHDVFSLWAVHFPLVPTHKESYMKLINSDNLISSANASEVFLVLSGHTHDPFDFSSPRMLFRALGTGTTTEFASSEGNYCQIISIENSDEGFLVGTEHYRFDSLSSSFTLA
jgi:DNA repair exonuclease SbcCD nuclease subunit